MESAVNFVDHFYQKYSGRGAVTVGVTNSFEIVYPLIFENGTNAPIGMLGMAWNKGTEMDLVQVYHISSFQNGLGHGSFMLQELCRVADDMEVKLYVQAEPLSNGREVISHGKLRSWYKQYGFVDNGTLTREPSKVT